ncbi:MAG: ATP synthase F1 subunit gamma [Tannerella sp.]|jgi:F-type H+-transporting ATPase subunit gamma|nr:ATP synthase F1 subunit gamma [Tannerella sp.]
MATLKEIKRRIASVVSTRKITSAMKMVSSAKLHKAQGVLKNLSPYSSALQHIMDCLVSGEYKSPLSESRAVRKAALIVFAADNALCGTYNANTIKELLKAVEAYQAQNVEVELYTVGKKVNDFAVKTGMAVARDYEKLSGPSAYAPVAELVDELMGQYLKGELDRVEMIFHRFKSTGSQRLVCETFLPLTPTRDESASKSVAIDYILEPDREALMQSLIPQSLRQQLYAALLHANASEHAIRMIAMQTATDNADELIDELTVAYNKSRQQAITSELLDIVGGTVNRE